jgi:phosphatidylglycerol:prolipoprotein diacylglycerol transferase
VAGAGAGAPAWIDQVLYRGLPFDSTASWPVHPTQLYESLGAALLLGALLLLRSRRAFRGQVFLAFVAGYGVLRFLLETVRDDPERGHYGPSAAPRVIVAIGLFALAVAFVAGPSRSLANPRRRAIARAAALLLPVVAYGLSGGRPSTPTPLSTSQWIAVLSSIAVAGAWRLLDRTTPRGAVP